MKSAAGSCLLTSMTLDQCEDMIEALAVRVPEGWAIPEPLVHLRAEIEGEPITIEDQA